MQVRVSRKRPYLGEFMPEEGVVLPSAASTRRPVVRLIPGRRYQAGQAKVGFGAPLNIAAGGTLPPGYVRRPLASFIARRRGGLVRQPGLEAGFGGGEGGGTPPKSPASKRQHRRWIPGLARRRRTWR
jgi:hypothetical protein